KYFTLVRGTTPATAEGKREPPSHLLRWVADAPFPGSVTLHARYLLAVCDQFAGRYDDADASLRTILRESDDGMALSPGFESELRQRLADADEALGRPEDAEAERKRASAALKGGRASEMPGITYTAAASGSATRPAGTSATTRRPRSASGPGGSV